MLENKIFEEIAVGDKASLTKTITEEDVILFAKASGDVNPVHLDKDYAATTDFKAPIAHGILTGSLISALLGTQLPGPGGIYLGQSFTFRRPVMINDTLTATVEVLEKKEKRQWLILSCTIVNQHGKTVLAGEASVVAPPEKLSFDDPKLPNIQVG